MNPEEGSPDAGGRWGGEPAPELHGEAFREGFAEAFRDGFGLGRRAELESPFQHVEEAGDLAGHEGEAGIELGAKVIVLGVLQLVDRAVEELQLPHDQVFAQA